MIMNFIEPHAHLNELTWVNLQEMYLSGIGEIISPIHLDAGKAVSCETIREMWDYLFEVQFARAENNFIKPYAMIGISMVSTPRGDAAELYEVLSDYLRRPEVVATGEIGIEPKSRTCKDVKRQEDIVTKQLEIAKEVGIPVDFHTPNPPDVKKQFTRRILELCRDANLPVSKVIIDHCTGANMEMVLDAGAWAAISVQPWRNMTPDLAADIITEYGFERIMVDSDFGGLHSDHLSVPKTAVALKRKGVSPENIEKVCSLNGKAAYGI
jgi:predicted metal-dependent TIM-barrel fold hydrolase